MNGFTDEREFRKWQAAVALQYGIEVAPTEEGDRREPKSHEWPKHPDEVSALLKETGRRLEPTWF